MKLKFHSHLSTWKFHGSFLLDYTLTDFLVICHAISRLRCYTFVGFKHCLLFVKELSWCILNILTRNVAILLKPVSSVFSC